MGEKVNNISTMFSINTVDLIETAIQAAIQRYDLNQTANELESDEKFVALLYNFKEKDHLNMQQKERILKNIFPQNELQLDYDTFKLQFMKNKEQIEIYLTQQGFGAILLPRPFTTVPNTGDGDCLYIAIGEALGEESADIRKYMTDGFMEWMDDQEKELRMTAIDVLKMYFNQSNELTLIENSKGKGTDQMKADFIKELQQSKKIWGDNNSIEMIIRSSRFKQHYPNTKFILFESAGGPKKQNGDGYLPKINCFYIPSDQKPIDCEFICLWKTTTGDNNVGGIHYELISRSDTKQKLFTVQNMEEWLKEMGYKSLQDNHEIKLCDNTFKLGCKADNGSATALRKQHSQQSTATNSNRQIDGSIIDLTGTDEDIGEVPLYPNRQTSPNQRTFKRNRDHFCF
jgi:hypothetical protein